MTRCLALPLLLAAVSQAQPLRLVIDPGHGGSNLGAAGIEDGLYEKRMTLELARLVRDQIRRQSPHTDVRLTRDSDRFVALTRRAAMANEVHAAAFVSLHFNASLDRQQQGFETYVHGDGPIFEPSEQPGAVGDILADLRRRAAMAESLHLAAIVQRHLAEALGPVGDRGIKRAPLDVLYEARVPAVLVEVGFMDHPEEGARMSDGNVLQDVAGALADALLEFGARREARKLVLFAQP